MPPELIADSFVSTAAVIGLLLLRSTLHTSDRSQWIKGRFSFAISVLIWMLAARVLFWLTDFKLFEIANLIAAALIPLAMLVLCEGLMRRHAHRVLKIGAVGGATAFAVIWPFELLFDAQLVSLTLLGFQLIFFVAIGFWVVMRDRSDLSMAENRIIDRLALSLLVIIPFAIADFRTDFFSSPVRLSGAAILFLCWLSLSLDRVRVSHLQTVYSCGLVLVGTGIAAVTISWLAELAPTQSVQAGAIILCSALVFQVYGEARFLRREDDRCNLLNYVAQADTDDSSGFLQGLQNHPLVSGALVLKESDLGDFDAAMRAHLRDTKIVTAMEGQDQVNAEISEQINWLLEKYGATHAFFVSDEPFRLVVINMPSLADTPGADLELAVVQRVAELMSKLKAAS